MLTEKLKMKKGVVGIIGLGYVGLPLALEFTNESIKVVGFDIDQEKISTIESGMSYIEHISNEKILKAISGTLSVTTDFSFIQKMDAIIICVPTPLDKFREPDLSYVTNTMENILPFLKKDQVLSLESTTYPGTCDEILKPMIEQKNISVGENFYLVYSPEREDPGRKDYTTKTIPKVCGGTTPKCLEVGLALYEPVIDTVVPVSSTKVAEMTKILENIHRAVNIGLVNELKIVADKMDIDIFEVIKAAATKPFGFTPYFPGPGIGGHCIPIDPYYLTWKAREFDVHTRFIELAGEINSSMPEYVVNKCILGLNKKKKSISGSKILILGVAYKQNVDDVRESPSVIIMEKLQDLGAELSYSDPHVPTFPKMRKHNFNLESIDLTTDSLASFDCVILMTAHEKFNLNLIKNSSSLIVDTRGVFEVSLKNVIRA